MPRGEKSPPSGLGGKILERYWLSVVAASVAEVITYPLDLIKTRLQIQGERGVAHGVYRGMISTGIGVAREEGVKALFQGVTPGIARHVVYSGVRMTSYELARIHWKNKGHDLHLYHRVLLGGFCGGLGQFFASPTDLVKVRLQMEGRRKMQGLPVRVQGIKDALKQIIREGGVIGLWKGTVPNVQRAALVNMGDLTAYDQSKSFLVSHGFQGESWTTHTLSSICAGFVAAVAGSPADVIKARIMNQPVDEKGRGLYYRGSVDCLMQAVKSEGVLSLYKGFIPCWTRMAPWSLTFWLCFEQLRNYANLETW